MVSGTNLQEWPAGEEPPPLVSVYIVSQDSAASMERAIRSVLDQTYDNLEVIIVEDCPDDRSAELIRSFSDPRIRLTVNERRLGVAVSLANAHGLSRGKYTCVLSSEDYFAPEKLSRQVVFMEAHPEIDALATPALEIDRWRAPNKAPEILIALDRYHDLTQPESWRWDIHVCPSSVLSKHRLVNELWSYDPDLLFANAWSNYIRLLAAGKVFSMISEPLTYCESARRSSSTTYDHRVFWEYAYVSARALHPYLDSIGRPDLIRKNIKRFLSDCRYPDSKLSQERLLRLLLTIDLTHADFASIWDDVLKSKPLPRDALHSTTSLIADARQALTERNRHLDSMRVEALRLENELFKVERLLHVLFHEDFSLVNLAKIGYLSLASIVPDLLKWPLRPLIRLARRQFRRGLARGKPKTHRLHLSTAPLPHRPKVLHAIANFNVGGSSRLVADIIEHLAHLFEQRVVSGFIPTPAAYSGCIARELRNQYEISRFLQKWTPDIVHVHYWGDTDWSWYDKVLRATEQLGVKVIENVNTPTRPYVAKSVRHYVYVSQYVKDTFGQDEGARSVVYPGSDFDLFSRRSRGDAPDDCIGMVYRLERDKLNAEAIEPFILVVQRRPATRVLIVGDGSQLDHYKARVAECGLSNSFHFTGAVPYAELPALYARMSVFMAPVWRESFGQVTPFAMSMELPVTGYAVGALPEILGGTDLLVPIGDSNRLAEITVSMLNDRPRRLAVGRYNRERALSQFSVRTMIEKYEHLYREVMEESG